MSNAVRGEGLKRFTLPDWRERLREVAREKGMRLTEVSERSGVPYKSLQRWLGSGPEPRLSDAIRIAVALGERVEYVFLGDDKAGERFLKRSLERIQAEARARKPDKNGRSKQARSR